MSLCLLLFLAGRGQAQQYPTPRLNALTPPGGQVGTTVTVTLTGVDLDEVDTLYLSHPGIKATRIPDPKPEKPATPPPVVPPKFELTIAANVPLGIHDLRAIGKWGISNPRAFVVGDLAEVQEQEPNNDLPQAQVIELNRVVNGVINANVDVDYYRFAGKAGQRVVVHGSCFSIDSRANPFLQLFDGGNRLLASNLRYRNRDALLDCELPADGDYLIRISEHAHVGGGADYFYRLTVSVGPWIDGAYPPVVEPGKPGKITLYGRNLPGGQPTPQTTATGRPLDRLEVTVTPPADPMSPQRLAFSGTVAPRSGGIDGFEHRVKNAAGTSNPVLLGYARAPIVLDNEANDGADQAQEVALPCEVCGRLEKLRDRDWYVFTARQNEVYLIEGFADRLRSPTDLYFELRRADNQQVLGEFDDHTDLPAAVGRFYTYSADPKARVVIPADGKYLLMVSGRMADVKAGPRRIYHLSIRPEVPDYRLVLVGNPSTSGAGCTLHQGGNQELQVVCYRQDGFDGEVTLSVEGLPPGVTCPPQVLGPNQRETYLVLSAAANAAAWAGEIRIKGTATIAGKKTEREGRAGCLVWPTAQANQPAVSRLARSICLAVRDQAPYSLSASSTEVAVPVGGNVDFKLGVKRQFPDFKAPVQLTRLSAPAQPNGNPINVPNVTLAANQTETNVRITVPNNTVPGTYNLVYQGTAQFPYNKDPKATQKPNTQVLEVTPAIRFTVYNTVAEVTLSAPSVTVKPGGEATLGIKLNRLHGYTGPFKVQLVLPSGFQGVSAAEATIPANASEARLTLKSPPSTKPATNPNLVIRLTSTVGSITLTQDARFAVTIAESVATQDGTEFKTTPILAASAADWKYAPAAQVQGDAWRGPDFNDQGWRSGKAPLGYGEEEIAKRQGTTLAEQGQPILCRRTFEVPSDVLAKPGAFFRLAVASDDSAVVHINGMLVDQDPEGDHEYSYWNREVELPAKFLRTGKNVVAVLVNNKQGSSDAFLDLEITAQVPVPKGNDGK
jgi:hypothetical protein